MTINFSNPKHLAILAVSILSISSIAFFVAFQLSQSNQNPVLSKSTLSSQSSVSSNSKFSSSSSLQESKSSSSPVSLQSSSVSTSLLSSSSKLNSSVNSISSSSGQGQTVQKPGFVEVTKRPLNTETKFVPSNLKYLEALTKKDLECAGNYIEGVEGYKSADGSPSRLYIPTQGGSDNAIDEFVNSKSNSLYFNKSFYCDNYTLSFHKDIKVGENTRSFLGFGSQGGTPKAEIHIIGKIGQQYYRVIHYPLQENSEEDIEKKCGGSGFGEASVKDSEIGKCFYKTVDEILTKQVLSEKVNSLLSLFSLNK